MKRIIALFSILLLLVPFTTLAQDFCQGNFDYDKDVDGSDAATFKSDFGRSTFKNPCPPDGPAPEPRTGQSTSYWYADDGYYQRGVSGPSGRFADNGDGTITDRLTGQIWLKNADCFGLLNWYDALTAANGLGHGACGLLDESQPGDWRLPNIRELQSLIDYSQYNPALPIGYPFVNVQSAFYWSSTTYAVNPGVAWNLNLAPGYSYYAAKTDGNYVWPIRGGH